jgi:hypothetical protein
MALEYIRRGRCIDMPNIFELQGEDYPRPSNGLRSGSNTQNWAYSDLVFPGGCTLGELRDQLNQVETQMFETYGPQHPPLSNGLLIANRLPSLWDTVIQEDPAAFCKMAEGNGTSEKLVRLEVVWSRSTPFIDEGSVE